MDAFRSLTGVVVFPGLLLLAGVAVRQRHQGGETPAVARFWRVVTLALVLLASASWARGFAPSLVADFLQACFFLALVFATDTWTDLGAAAGGEEKLALWNATLFVISLLTYFVIIPGLWDPQSYEAASSSFLFALCLDLFLAGRFAYAAGVARSGRWRRVHSLFFGFCAVSASLDGLRLFGFDVAWELSWLALPLVVVLASRVGATAAGATAEGATAEVSVHLDSTQPRSWESFAFYAILFPGLHNLLDFYGRLTSGGRIAQQGLVIVYTLGVGSLAVIYGTRGESRRRQAEIGLGESEDRYRQLIETYPDAILVEQDGELVYANATASEKLDPQELGSVLAKLSVEKSEIRVRGVGGESVDLAVSRHEISFQGRDALQVIARDVTEVRHMHRAAEEAARLSSLGRLSAALAHEIRNPLAAVVMNLSVLSSRLPKRGESFEILSEMKRAVGHLKLLVDGVLDFVRPAPPHRVAQEVVDVIDSALFRLQGSGIEIVKDYRHWSSQVEIDATQMNVAFTHILDNAVQAQGGSGTITVRTVNPSPSSFEIVVEDTGQGIPAGDLERVFEPFKSGWEGGVGLGLPLVARILKQHDCQYRLESESGEGSRFVFEFELAEVGPS
jgi:signal transduction histidine kinase